jgi:NAD(P)H-hydrate epimerase
VKTPALTTEFAGRLRYLDLGFFSGETRGNERVLTSQILAPLAAFRSPQSDKRSYGHLFVVAGSRSFPGAPMMTVLAALRSGVGLLTAFVPESLVSAYAARVPEAIWVGWPETPDGGLALEGLHLLRERIDRADALVIGPGISRETETLAMVTGLVKAVQIPVLLDADALQPEVIREAKSPLVLTPHAGEYARIGGTGTIEEFAASTPGAVVVLKGPLTRIVVAEIVSDDMTIERSQRCVTTYHSLFGGPVLARGGSGDLLAGVIGAMLAQTPLDPVLAAARGTVWHGLAADLLAQSLGQVAVTTTQLLDFMPAALRDSVRELGGSE